MELPSSLELATAAKKLMLSRSIGETLYAPKLHCAGDVLAMCALFHEMPQHPDVVFMACMLETMVRDDPMDEVIFVARKKVTAEGKEEIEFPSVLPSPSRPLPSGQTSLGGPGGASGAGSSGTGMGMRRNISTGNLASSSSLALHGSSMQERRATPTAGGGQSPMAGAQRAGGSPMQFAVGPEEALVAGRRLEFSLHSRLPSPVQSLESALLTAPDLLSPHPPSLVSSAEQNPPTISHPSGLPSPQKAFASEPSVAAAATGTAPGVGRSGVGSHRHPTHSPAQVRGTPPRVVPSLAMGGGNSSNGTAGGAGGAFFSLPPSGLPAAPNTAANGVAIAPPTGSTLFPQPLAGAPEACSLTRDGVQEHYQQSTGAPHFAPHNDEGPTARPHRPAQPPRTPTTQMPSEFRISSPSTPYPSQTVTMSEFGERLLRVQVLSQCVTLLAPASTHYCKLIPITIQRPGLRVNLQSAVLHFAAAAGNVGVLQQLLLELRSPQLFSGLVRRLASECQGFCISHAAALTGDIPTLHFLANRGGVSLFTSDEFGWTCAHNAAQTGQLDTLKFLTAVNAARMLSAKTATGWTPAHVAASSDQSEILLWLLEDRKVDFTAQVDIRNATPLHYLAQLGYTSTLRLLVDSALNMLEQIKLEWLDWAEPGATFSIDDLWPNQRKGYTVATALLKGLVDAADATSMTPVSLMQLHPDSHAGGPQEADADAIRHFAAQYSAVRDSELADVEEEEEEERENEAAGEQVEVIQGARAEAPSNRMPQIV
jgi:ankyrin repeat protein